MANRKTFMSSSAIMAGARYAKAGNAQPRCSTHRPKRSKPVDKWRAKARANC